MKFEVRGLLIAQLNFESKSVQCSPGASKQKVWRGLANCFTVESRHSLSRKAYPLPAYCRKGPLLPVWNWFVLTPAHLLLSSISRGISFVDWRAIGLTQQWHIKLLQRDHCIYTRVILYCILDRLVYSCCSYFLKKTNCKAPFIPVPLQSPLTLECTFDATFLKQ